MKFVKYLLLLILVLIVGLAIYAAFQPSEFEVTRTRSIDAPVEFVYNYVDEYKNWEHWGPWAEEDPSMTYTYADQTKGLGASYSWSGKDGDGSCTTIEAVQNESLVNELDFGGMGKANGFWKFSQADGGTEVTWGVKQSDAPYMLKLFGAISGGYDGMMGPMFERGLEKMDSLILVKAKEHSEMMSQFKIGDITQKSVDGQKFVGYAHSTKIDMEALMKIYAESLPKAGEYAISKGLQYGEFVPGSIITKWDEENGEAEFMVGVFLNGELEPGEDMVSMDLAKGNRVFVSKFGNYGTGDDEAHKAINAYIQENNLNISGPVYEMYVNDPTSVKPIEIQTDIYYPIN